jgi:hypothetical protein
MLRLKQVSTTMHLSDAKVETNIARWHLASGANVISL